MSGRYSPDHADGGGGRAPTRPKRRNAAALKPGSSSASPPPSVEVDKPGGRRARVAAVYAAMAANDARKSGKDVADG
jgi:hypothetical protein